MLVPRFTLYSSSSSLRPGRSEADDGASGTGETDQSIVEGDEPKRGARDGEVTKVGEELQLSGAARAVIGVSKVDMPQRRLSINISYLWSFFSSTAFSASALSAFFLVAACKL
jgi:hypothetical protein